MINYYYYSVVVVTEHQGILKIIKILSYKDFKLSVLGDGIEAETVK